MASTRVDHVRIAGLACALPDRTRGLEEDGQIFGAEEVRRVARNTGIHRRAVAEALCASDLCQAAAERLLAELGWARDTVDVLVFVTQTPDYPSPATACLLQQRLRLGPGVAAFDINLGCSGYTYGLWTVASLLSAGRLRRGLLLAGDVVSRFAAPTDRAVVPVFGDAGSATALEFAEDAPPIFAELGTDGAGALHLHALAGGARHPIRPEDLEPIPRADGVCRSNQQIYMNGAEVVAFSLKNVPAVTQAVRGSAGWSEEDVEHYVFHQASEFMLKNIARAGRLPAAKVVIGMDGFGNTGSASIPLAISDRLPQVASSTRRTILSGFGVGWSWCALGLELGPLVVPPIARVPDLAIRGELESVEANQPVGAGTERSEG